MLKALAENTTNELADSQNESKQSSCDSKKVSEPKMKQNLFAATIRNYSVYNLVGPAMVKYFFALDGFTFLSWDWDCLNHSI